MDWPTRLTRRRRLRVAKPSGYRSNIRNHQERSECLRWEPKHRLGYQCLRILLCCPLKQARRHRCELQIWSKIVITRTSLVSETFIEIARVLFNLFNLGNLTIFIGISKMGQVIRITKLVGIDLQKKTNSPPDAQSGSGL
ncbi:MAG: hypothetical protein ACI8Z1_001364 [Candidatus Azotimanducaceae bacterium]|jgi:hypothetical protein